MTQNGNLLAIARRAAAQADRTGCDLPIVSVIEARPESHQPTAVTHQASTVDDGVGGAADKLARLVESALGRLHDQKVHQTDRSASGQRVA